VELELESLLEGARNSRPDLRAHQLAIAQLDTDIALNQRLNRPNPAIGMFFGHENNTEHFIGPLFGLSVPLFNQRVGEATIPLHAALIYRWLVPDNAKPAAQKAA
jgi:outer membrane protein TolC